MRWQVTGPKERCTGIQTVPLGDPVASNNCRLNLGELVESLRQATAAEKAGLTGC